MLLRRFHALCTISFLLPCVTAAAAPPTARTAKESERLDPNNDRRIGEAEAPAVIRPDAEDRDADALGQSRAEHGNAASPLYEAKLLFASDRLKLPDGRLAHNHSPSIVELPGGELLACWFHGRGEREDNTMVVMGSRLKPETATWSQPFVLADHPQLPDQNPTLFVDPQGRLWLFRISSLDNEVRGHFMTYVVSTDYDGEGPPRWNWQAPLFCFPRNLDEVYPRAVDRLLADERLSEPQRTELLRLKDMAREKLWHRLGWMPRQPPIMLNEKRMMLGLYSDLWGCSLMAFTDDGGATWEFSPPMILPRSPLVRTVQPSLVLKKNGNVVAFMRGRRAGRLVHRAESSDGGMTWTEDPLDLKCADSSVAVLGLSNGNWVLAVNDAGGRHVLTLYLSDDEGRTWKWNRRLEEFAPGEGTGQYPTLIQAADGSIHIVYTYTNAAEFPGRTIKHVRLNEAWVTGAE